MWGRTITTLALIKFPSLCSVAVFASEHFQAFLSYFRGRIPAWSCIEFRRKAPGYGFVFLLAFILARSWGHGTVISGMIWGISSVNHRRSDIDIERDSSVSGRWLWVHSKWCKSFHQISALNLWHVSERAMLTTAKNRPALVVPDYVMHLTLKL